MSNELRASVLAAMSSLSEVLEVINSSEAPSAPSADPTKEEIGENVSGNPDLWKDNPELYGKMSQFYNPAKAPFTSSSWMTTGILGYAGKGPGPDGFLKDARPYKVEDRDGVPYQKSNPQAGPDWYWIGLGVSDVTAKEWNAQEIVQDLPREQRLENIRNYQGGLRTPLSGWPTTERAAYNVTH